jgi:hypothetical protein
MITRSISGQQGAALYQPTLLSVNVILFAVRCFGQAFLPKSGNSPGISDSSANKRYEIT